MTRKPTVKDIKTGKQLLAIQLTILMEVIPNALPNFLIITTQDSCTHAHEYPRITSDMFGLLLRNLNTNSELKPCISTSTKILSPVWMKDEIQTFEIVSNSLPPDRWSERHSTWSKAYQPNKWRQRRRSSPTHITSIKRNPKQKGSSLPSRNVVQQETWERTARRCQHCKPEP